MSHLTIELDIYRMDIGHIQNLLHVLFQMRHVGHVGGG